MQLPLRVVLLAAFPACLAGCSVVTVAGTAASVAVTAGSVAVTAGSLAVDAAVGTVELTGKAVGAAAAAVRPPSAD